MRNSELKLVVPALLSLVISLSVSTSFAIAEEMAVAPDTVILESPEELDFSPSEAALLAGFDTGEVLSVVASVIQPQRIAKDSSDVSRWWLAAPVRIPVGAKNVTWVARIVAPNGVVSFTAPRERSLIEVDGVTQLRAEVQQLSTQASEARKELAGLEKEMTRLRAEAELIGNFGRIIDAQEELDRTEGQLAQLADHSVSVEQFIRRTQEFVVPGSPVAREQQLIREIATLAEATQKAERSEFIRKSSSEREAQRMMEALEEARNPATQDPEYLAELRKDLAKLIAQREQLESAVEQ